MRPPAGSTAAPPWSVCPCPPAGPKPSKPTPAPTSNPPRKSTPSAATPPAETTVSAPDTKPPATPPMPPAPEAGGEGFLARWSRRKRAAEAGQSPPDPAPPMPVAVQPSAPVALPDPASLGFDDDFTRDLGAQVPAALKRAAMARLFADPCFNQMDGLDVYIEDYNRVPNLPAEERDLLAHAKAVLNPADMAANDTPPAEEQALAIESPAPAASTRLPAEPPSWPEAAPPVAIPSADAAGEAVPPAGTHSRT